MANEKNPYHLVTVVGGDGDWNSWQNVVRENVQTGKSVTVRTDRAQFSGRKREEFYSKTVFRNDARVVQSACGVPAFRSRLSSRIRK